MKGCLPAGIVSGGWCMVLTHEETAMRTVTQIGVDCHRVFSDASARDVHGELVWREQLRHEDRQQLRQQLRRWPGGVPVVLEGTFGWGWLSDELQEAGLQPHLASSKK